jgi:hypothetical protein
LPDIVIGNKKGTFVFVHQTHSISEEEWVKAQPAVLYPEAGDKDLKAGDVIQRAGVPAK